MSGADLFKQNADDCRQRSVEAGTAYEKADWFELAEEWQKLAWTGALLITVTVLALSIIARSLTSARKSQ